jgi:hypothetical protein
MGGFTGKSIQGKVFRATFGIGLITDLIGSVLLYDTIPAERTNSKTRFWARYVMSTALTVIVGIGGSIAADALSECGWVKTSWGVALIPMAIILISSFMIQGVNTVLDSTSGQSCIGIITTALKEHKKKCVKDTTTKLSEEI